MRRTFIYFIVSMMATVFSANAIAAEVKKQPITQPEIQFLSSFSGEQIKNVIAGDGAVIAQVADQAGIEQTQLEQSLAQLSMVDQETLSSTSSDNIDAIIAGEMEGSDILVAALAAVGILFLVAVAAA